jgi:hypothetical protein
MTFPLPTSSFPQAESPARCRTITANSRFTLPSAKPCRLYRCNVERRRSAGERSRSGSDRAAPRMPPGSAQPRPRRLRAAPPRSLVVACSPWNESSRTRRRASTTSPCTTRSSTFRRSGSGSRRGRTRYRSPSGTKPSSIAGLSSTKPHRMRAVPGKRSRPTSGRASRRVDAAADPQAV